MPWSAKAGIPWESVRQAAEVGATHQEIVRALQIPEQALANHGDLGRFREEIARGDAVFKLTLRQHIVSRGRSSTRNSGSVNALALLARNHLDFDRQLAAQEAEPDLTTARPRLRDLLVRLAGQRSDAEGKTVTPLELIRREAEAVEGAAGGA